MSGALRLSGALHLLGTLRLLGTLHLLGVLRSLGALRVLVGIRLAVSSAFCLAAGSTGIRSAAGFAVSFIAELLPRVSLRYDGFCNFGFYIGFYIAHVRKSACAEFCAGHDMRADVRHVLDVGGLHLWIAR